MTDNQNDKKMDSAELKAIADKVKQSTDDLAKSLSMMGHALWLYMQSNVHRHYFIQDLESRLVPALMKTQFKLYLQSKTGSLPMAFVSWAKLSDEAEKSFLATGRIAPKDWDSGDNLWLVDVLIPFGGHLKIYSDLNEQVFKGSTVYIQYPGPDGNLTKKSLRDVAEMLTGSKQDETKNEAKH